MSGFDPSVDTLYTPSRFNYFAEHEVSYLYNSVSGQIMRLDEKSRVIMEKALAMVELDGGCGDPRRSRGFGAGRSALSSSTSTSSFR